MDEVEYNEIVFGDVTVTDGKKEHTLSDVVYKNTDGCYHRLHHLAKVGIKTPPKVVSVTVKARLGFAAENTKR